MAEVRVDKSLDFRSECDAFRSFLADEKHATMVLATSANDRVLARTVLVAADGVDLYCFTWEQSRKCEQIRRNPRVALGVDTLQLEGRAELLGPLSDPETPGVSVMHARFPESVERWQKRPGMIMLRIRPTLVVLGDPIDGEPGLHFIDFENRVAYGQFWANR
jgi:general stress protein 26